MTASDRADDRASDRADDRSTDDPGSSRDGSLHHPEICGVCPVCSAARALDGARPELLEHLSEAARHLAAALRVMVAAAGETETPAEHDDDTEPGPGTTTSRQDAAREGDRTSGHADEVDNGGDDQSEDEGPRIRTRKQQRGTTGATARRIRRIDLD